MKFGLRRSPSSLPHNWRRSLKFFSSSFAQYLRKICGSPCLEFSWKFGFGGALGGPRTETFLVIQCVIGTFVPWSNAPKKDQEILPFSVLRPTKRFVSLVTLADPNFGLETPSVWEGGGPVCRGWLLVSKIRHCMGCKTSSWKFRAFFLTLLCALRKSCFDFCHPWSFSIPTPSPPPNNKMGSIRI